MSELALPRGTSPQVSAPTRAQLWRAELARRNALARQKQPEGIAGPSWRLLLGELRSGYESWRAWRDQRESAQATQSPVPVILLPGFGCHPVRMWRLRAALSRAGHDVDDWGLGWNLGGTAEKLDRLAQRVEDAAASAGQPVALVGWSLGGLYAREVAKRVPDAVRLVVTMGTPFSGDLHANNAWRAYQWVTGQDVSAPPIPGDYAVKPPVPTYALWSPRDGVVSPRSARGRPEERDEAIALRCTHLGFAGHPSVFAQLSRILDAAAAKKALPASRKAH